MKDLTVILFSWSTTCLLCFLIGMITGIRYHDDIYEALKEDDTDDSKSIQ